MANSDITQVLAGQFLTNVIPLKTQLLIQAYCWAAQAIPTATPTNAQFDTLVQTAFKMRPPVPIVDPEAVETAIAYNSGVAGTLGSGLLASGLTNNTLLSRAKYLQGYDEQTLRAIIMFCRGKALGVLG